MTTPTATATQRRQAAADRAELQQATEHVGLVRGRLTEARLRLDQFVRSQYAALQDASVSAPLVAARACGRSPKESRPYPRRRTSNGSDWPAAWPS